MADISKQIRMCVETGKVKFGERDAIKASLLGTAKLFIVSANIKEEVKSDIEHNAKLSGTPVISYEGKGYELGSVCGVPYVVSVMAVFDEGDSSLVSESAKKKE